jgi:hypothetical protein
MSGQKYVKDVDVRLCAGLQARMSGQKYVKESALTMAVLLAHVKECAGLPVQGLPAQRSQTYVKECALTRAVLLAHLKERGDVTQVKLLRVTVQEMGGRIFGVTLDETINQVKDLKSAVADQEGVAAWTQQLFRFGADAGTSAEPLVDSLTVSDEDQFALCVDDRNGKVHFVVSNAGFEDINGDWGVDPEHSEKDGKAHYKKLKPDGTFHASIRPGSRCLGWSEENGRWMFYNVGGDHGNDWPYANYGGSSVPPATGWVKVEDCGVDSVPTLTWVK